MKQREFYRLEVDGKCMVKLSKIGERLMNYKDPFPVQLKDLSGKGLCFCSERDIPTSEWLTWQFEFKIMKQTFDLYGHIRWKRPVDNQMVYGVELLFINDSDQEELLTSINALAIQRRMSERIAQQ